MRLDLHGRCEWYLSETQPVEDSYQPTRPKKLFFLKRRDIDLGDGNMVYVLTLLPG